MNNRKIFYKIISFLIILIVFFFLGKGLVDNWQKVKDYDFSFNYFYLILSFIFVFWGIIMHGFIWNSILRKLEPDKKLSNFKALKFFVYSWFGRYIPGKAWMYLGRVYFGTKEGLSKRSLSLSVIYEIVLSIASAFLISILILFPVFGFNFFGFMPGMNVFFVLCIVVLGLVFIHPRIFSWFLNLALKILKQNISFDKYLGYLSIIKIILYYFVSFIFNGIGFFFLVKSIIDINFSAILGIIGIFNLASVLGIVALFAPSGIGVREAFLVLFMQAYLPLSIVIVISLIARIWATIAELFVFLSVYFISKISSR